MQGKPFFIAYISDSITLVHKISFIERTKLGANCEVGGDTKAKMIQGVPKTNKYFLC